MSKAEAIKAEIGFHEKMFFAALAGLLTLIGWLASNYQSAATWIVFLAVCGLIGSGLFGIDQYRRIKWLISELEKC